MLEEMCDILNFKRKRKKLKKKKMKIFKIENEIFFGCYHKINMISMKVR